MERVFWRGLKREAKFVRVDHLAGSLKSLSLEILNRSRAGEMIRLALTWNGAGVDLEWGRGREDALPGNSQSVDALSP